MSKSTFSQEAAKEAAAPVSLQPLPKELRSAPPPQPEEMPHAELADLPASLKGLFF